MVWLKISGSPIYPQSHTNKDKQKCSRSIDESSILHHWNTSYQSDDPLYVIGVIKESQNSTLTAPEQTLASDETKKCGSTGSTHYKITLTAIRHSNRELRAAPREGR
jgi:hypothetical protein